MRSAALLLALLPLIGGCATQGPGGDAAPARFLPPQDLGAGGPEPVVALAPDGVLYVAAQDPLGRGPRVWVSRDHGASFELRRPASEGGGEVDIAAGPGGAVYVTQLGTRGNVISVSHDHGETWQTSPLGGQTQYFDREWLAVDEAGAAYAVARQFGTTTAAGVSRSDDDGGTWLPVGRPWDATNEPGLANGNLVARGGALHLIYLCRDAQGVCVATSRDRGITWTQALVAERSAGVDHVYPALGAGSALHAVWSEATDGRLAVWESHSSDAASWSAPRQVSAKGETATLPWVAARGATTWIVWLRADRPLAATDSAAAEDASWTPVALRLGDAAAIELTTEPVHVGVISPPVGQAGRARDRNFGDFFTAAIAGNGKLVVAVSKDEGSPETTRDLVIREA